MIVSESRSVDANKQSSELVLAERLDELTTRAECGEQRSRVALGECPEHVEQPDAIFALTITTILATFPATASRATSSNSNAFKAAGNSGKEDE